MPGCRTLPVATCVTQGWAWGNLDIAAVSPIQELYFSPLAGGTLLRYPLRIQGQNARLAGMALTRQIGTACYPIVAIRITSPTVRAMILQRMEEGGEGRRNSRVSSAGVNYSQERDSYVTNITVAMSVIVHLRV